MAGLVHPHGDHQPGGGGESVDGPHCCPDTEGVGDHAGERGAVGEACVTDSNTIGGLASGGARQDTVSPDVAPACSRRVAASFSPATEGRLGAAVRRAMSSASG